MSNSICIGTVKWIEFAFSMYEYELAFKTKINRELYLKLNDAKLNIPEELGTVTCSQ